MDIFTNLSPIDHRYRASNPELFDSLSAILSEQAAIGYQLRAEAALLKAHLQQRQQLNAQNIATIEQAIAKITPAEVYREEEQTRHNIRALVNVLAKHLPGPLAPLVHLGATSMDIVDTVASLRVKDAMHRVILPELMQLEKTLIDLCQAHADTPQIGRTHGQYAVPITVGHTFAEYVSRLGQSLVRLEELTQQLCGKLSGAVGAYNATSLITGHPRAFEACYLGFLGLKAGEYSSQIVMPEYLLRLLQELNLAFGVVANLADDLRHLQRSEIDEVREFFSAGQVGSSTMPQKRNPWNCEHVKSLWKAFFPRMVSFYLDQVSEHQRDLTNSASSRFIADYLTGVCLAVHRMRKVLTGLSVHHQQLQHNLQQTGDLIMAEPLYILLAMSGLPDAHETVRQLTLERQKTGVPIGQLIQQCPELQQRLTEQLARVGYDEAFLNDPTRYTGRSAQHAREIALHYQQEVDAIRRRLSTDG